MQSNTSLTIQILDLLNEQVKITEKQSEMITKLVNENLEKENMINEILKDIEES